MPASDNQLLDFILFDEEVVAGNITKKGDAPAYPANLNKVLDRTDYETYADLDFTSMDSDAEGFLSNHIPKLSKVKQHAILAPVLLSTGGTAHSRTDYGATWVASKAFDGDLGTYYHSEVGSDEWISYIFDENVIPQKVRIYWNYGSHMYSGAHRPTNATIETSTNTTNGNDGDWVTVETGVSIENATGWYEFDITASSCKAIRLHQSSGLFLVVDEMEILG